jgi:methyl-accepting chemotaxis protein-1 (serine sensor receptor)
MNNLSIKMRLIVTLAVLGALLVAIGILGVVALSKSNESLRSVYEDRTVPLDQVTMIDRLILRNRLLIAVSLVTPEPKYVHDNMDQMDKNIAEIGKIWDAYMATYLTPEEKKIAEKFADDRKKFVMEGLKPVAAAMRIGKMDEAKKLVANQVRPLYGPVGEGVNALIKLQIDVAKQEYEEGVSRYNTLRAVAIGAIVFGLVIAGVMGWLLIQAIMRPLNAAVTLATRVANGELDGSVHIERDDELGKLMQALKNMTENLSKIVTEVRNAADTVGSAAKQISAGNNDLSQRTQEQASALEETASSMEEMTSTTKQSADNARQANQLAAGTRDQASQGGQVVSDAVQAMSEINTSSKKIADIIGVIDEIAFQTNLLALNAAVEAARAGEQGRGFAVVASEVRNLAQRSATAAKEIKGLINDSVEKVHSGSKLVDASGETLNEIVDSVKKVSDIVAEIAAASQEQSSGIEQVNKAIMQMDEVTQQNAALVEEAAAASKSMEDQALKMVELMSFFRTAGHASVSALAPASKPAHAPHKERLVAAGSGQRAAATAKVAASRGHGAATEEWAEF